MKWTSRHAYCYYGINGDPERVKVSQKMADIKIRN